MANKPVNTSSAEGGSFDKSLSKDLSGSHKEANQWTKARNAVNNTIKGDVGELSNEASNYLSTQAPYDIIGVIHLTGDEWAVFSTDDTNSESGIFKEDTQSYETVVNDSIEPCINFNRQHLIKGVSKSSFKCSYQVYWDDGVNPTRTLDLTDVPWVENCTTDAGNCTTCVPTDVLDCEKLRLAPVLRDLSFRVEAGQATGEVPNGSYYVVGAYLVSGQRVTDYSVPSNVQGVFTHENLQSSLDIYIEEADQEFDEFELIIVQFVNYNTVAQKLGVYSTRQKKITVDIIDEKLPAVDVGEILTNNPVIDKSDAIFRNGDFLLRVGPTEKFNFNYQPLANQITSSWVSVEYDADYYAKGGHQTSYMRDENYSFFVRWVFNTGDKTSSFHIPGRMAAAADLAVTTNDVLDGEDGINWKIHNTATNNASYPGIGTTLPDGGVIIGGGKMGYWESSEIYDDDNPEVWNSSHVNEYGIRIGGTTDTRYDLCGRNIRHHKFPDNATDPGANMVTNHYDPIDGSKIRVMGIQFDNIAAPVDNYGVPIPNVVGYEILRGSREGNKTVLAKGMINNTRRYVPNGTSDSRDYLYPNYPYNPTTQYDRFLSQYPTKYSAKKNPNSKGFNSLLNLQGEPNGFDAFLSTDFGTRKDYLDLPLGVDITEFPSSEYHRYQDNTLGSNAVRDVLTFHSPETNFRNPFLSAKELKIYGELKGTVEGKFEIPKDHPKHKFITDTTFLMSSIIGVGYAILAMEGERSQTNTTPRADTGGSYTQLGPSTGTTGILGASAPQHTLLTSSVFTATLADRGIKFTFREGGLPILGLPFGINVIEIAETSLQTVALTSGAAGGAGGETSQTRSETPWQNTPLPIRVIAGIPAFLGFYAQGTDQMLDVIYAFTPNRQYALQYISHCFYNEFIAPESPNLRRRIDFESYLGPNLQNFTQNYKINNIYRSKSVGIKITEDLGFTQTEDDTQVTFSEKFGRERDGNNSWDENNLNTEFNDGVGTTAASHYAAIKQPLDNQYGQIANIIQVPVSTDVTPKDENAGVLFNGDIYINRYSEKNTMFFFYDWMKGQPDGFEYDYRLRNMVAHPRFWMNTEKFDTGEFVSSLLSIFEGGEDAPKEFDVFMTEDPTDTCECGNYGDCYLDSDEVEEYCDCLDELEEKTLYVSWLTDCQNYRADQDDGDPDPEPNPFGSPDYAGCPDCQTACPDWNNPEESDGKWARKIRRAGRRVGRQERKCQKIKNGLYDQYIDILTGSTSGGNKLSQLFDGIQTPRDKFGFDMRKAPRMRFSVKEAYMYLFNSGVRDFFVESEINIAHRDWGDRDRERHYDETRYSDLRELFSTDHIKDGNFYKYDYSLSVAKLFNNFVSWGTLQDRDYNPYLAEKCFIYRPKRINYSLPQNLENKKDLWRAFLPNNYADFKSEPTAVKAIGKNGAIILFRNESPVQFAARDTLQTDGGTKLVIGDGGLFNQQALQNLVNAEDPHEYGSCQNRLSVINTPAGLYYISQNQGKIFMVTGEGLKEVSNMGLKWWFVKYLPYKLTEDFPEFELQDNPLVGIGCQSVFDNENQIAFFCKKDYQLRRDVQDTVEYIGGTTFRVNGYLNIQLGDPAYFRDASWTMSFDPKSQSWISHHDWHPDLVLPSKKTFMTTKGNGLWVHADRCDSYCNFYGIDYPFEVEFSLYTQAQVSTLRNIMYFMEVYKYNDNCDDRFHVLDFNFDEAIIHNSEQCSGLLRLNLTPKNDPLTMVNYPLINAQDIDILYAKEEHKYRFNQFWDITDDRGEFNAAAERTIFDTEPNGYVRNLNPANLNYNKFALERKKFRHLKNTVLLRRRVSGNRNMVISLALQMNLNSSR